MTTTTEPPEPGARLLSDIRRWYGQAATDELFQVATRGWDERVEPLGGHELAAYGETWRLTMVRAHETGHEELAATWKERAASDFERSGCAHGEALLLLTEFFDHVAAAGLGRPDRDPATPPTAESVDAARRVLDAMEGMAGAGEPGPISEATLLAAVAERRGFLLGEIAAADDTDPLFAQARASYARATDLAAGDARRSFKSRAALTNLDWKVATDGGRAAVREALSYLLEEASRLDVAADIVAIAGVNLQRMDAGDDVLLPYEVL